MNHTLGILRSDATVQDSDKPAKDVDCQANPPGELVTEDKRVEGVDRNCASEVRSSRVSNLSKDP